MRSLIKLMIFFIYVKLLIMLMLFCCYFRNRPADDPGGPCGCPCAHGHHVDDR